MSAAPGAVVVGTDGSPAAGEAIAWAARFAAGTAAPLRVVRAYDSPDMWPATVAEGLAIDEAEVRHRVMISTWTQLDQVIPGPPVPDLDLVAGRPTEVLAEAARDAAMLVVGHRGLGGWRSLTLGSVGLGVLFRAPCPVTVVRPAPGDGPIVVGIDGSDDSRRALRFGIEEAGRRGVRVVAVTGSVPAVSMLMSYRPGIVPDVSQYQRSLEQRARAFVDAAVGEAVRVGSGVDEVDLELVPLPAAEAVAETARDVGAALVVLGHTGRGAVASRMFGSVGYELVLHAPCPVTVIPDPAAAAERVRRAAERAAEPTLGGPLPIGPIA